MGRHGGEIDAESFRTGLVVAAFYSFRFLYMTIDK